MSESSTPSGANIDPGPAAGGGELPDRLSVDPRSRFFDAKVLEREIGIRFNGQERTNVEEYCVSEGWIRVAAGKSFDRHGKAVTLRLNGKVEPFFKT
jgi:hypothetical protein